MKKRKILLGLALAAAAVFSLSACGEDKPADPTPTTEGGEGTTPDTKPDGDKGTGGGTVTPTTQKFDVKFMNGTTELTDLKQSVEKIKVEDLKINVIRCSVGAITDTDISLAEASHAIVIGFNVRPSQAVRDGAQSKGVEIRLYSIIYKLLEDIEAALKGMLEPEYEEVITGHAEVRQTYKISSVGTVAGCYVTDGSIASHSLVHIVRDGIVVYEGQMASLRRFKDDVKEVKAGFECGITIEKFNDIKEGDVFEASIMKEIKRK